MAKDATWKWAEGIPRLTYEQFQAGHPCPGCGLPLLAGQALKQPGNMHWTPEERERVDAEQARFRALHGDHLGPTNRPNSAGWSVEGSITKHCYTCCPPPPLSPGQIATLRQLLTNRPGAAGPRPGPSR